MTLEIEPPPATATIAIEVSPGSAPAGSVAELDASPPPVVNPPAPLASEPPAVSKQDQPPAATEQQPLIVAEARVGERASLASTSATTSVEPAPVEKRAVSEPEVPTPAETAEPATQNRGDAATAVNSSEIAKPDQHISSPQQKETVGPQQSEPPGGGQQPPSIPSVAPQPNPEQASPSVPLPQRAPKAAMEKASPKPAVKEKSASKPAAKHDQPEQETSNTTSRRKPMGLAPTDKPSTALTQGQPNWPGADSYSVKIWSALARKKPNTGEHGSTTVTFAIGPAGALCFVRISQSSGNGRLDQLALATVRNAAPFPPPPVLRDGTAAYTIRIDFH